VAQEQLMLVSTGASDWIESHGSASAVEGGFRVSARKSPASGAPAGAVLVSSARWETAPDGPQVIHFSVPFAADDGRLRVSQEAIDRLERDCDEANAPLPELRSFVLPGGNEGAARLHIARAVCRRAESVVIWAATERPVNPLVPVYLNRLSDFLFILARAANAGGDEPLWLPGGDR